MTGRHYLQGLVFGLLFRERSWLLLFWLLKDLQHDRWQIDYKLFEIYSSTNTFRYGNEQRDHLNCGFSLTTLWYADMQTQTHRHSLGCLFWTHITCCNILMCIRWELRKIYVVELFLFCGIAGVFFFTWGKWTYVHTENTKTNTCRLQAHKQYIYRQTHMHLLLLWW